MLKFSEVRREERDPDAKKNKKVWGCGTVVATDAMLLNKDATLQTMNKRCAVAGRINSRRTTSIRLPPVRRANPCAGGRSAVRRG